MHLPRHFVLFVLILALAVMACEVQVSTPSPTPLAEVLPTVKPTEHPTKLPTAAKAWTASVELPTVNVREKPSGKVIASLSAGDEVIIMKCDSSWCKIKEPAGYVWRGCLSDNPEGLGCVSQ